MHKIPVGVLGASGYAGRELLALLHRHPNFEIAFAAANSRRGETVVVGSAREQRRVTLVGIEDAPLSSAALVFSALPHGASAPWVARSRTVGARVVDLSSDFRPGNAVPRLEPLLAAVLDASAPYGLTEDTRPALEGAGLVANPGCYPTAVLLGLRPLARRGLIDDDGTIVVNAASGVSGAGNNPRPELMFGEIAENYRPYGIGNEHRHLAEMRATLSGWGTQADLVFTPHLLPVTRGILATMVVPLAEEVRDPASLWSSDYELEPFVVVSSEAPSLRDVIHTNTVRIAVRPVAHMSRPAVQVLAAIDNLMKGAAGQAVQNANVLFELDEASGLPS